MIKKSILSTPYSSLRKSKNLVIGKDDDFFNCEIDSKGRSQHTHVIGATNSGKSRFLLSQIIQDIKAGRGVCVIDPHDELIDHIRDWLAKNETVAQRRIIRLLDLNDQEYSFGFNPLAVDDDRKINATVDQAVNAMASVMGGEDLTQTPLLRMTLHAICTALASARLTLEEAQYLVNPRFPTERHAITSTITNPTWKRVWDSFNEMAERHPKMYMEYFQAAERRFIPFIADENVRAILGQNQNTLDLKQAMDESEILLVNVSRTGGFVASESSQIIARLLINNLIAKAYTREPRKARPFNLFVDEVQNFLSGDIPEILSQCRKFGLYLTLSHQYLGQLKDAGDLVYAGVMGTARNKIAFSVDDPSDAQELAERIFAGMTNYEMPKQSMIKPTVVGHQIIRLQNHTMGQNSSTTLSETDAEASSYVFGTSQGHADSYASASGTAESETTSETQMMLPPTTMDTGTTDLTGMSIAQASGVVMTKTEASMSGSMYGSSEAQGHALSKAQGKAATRGQSTSQGYSEALMPIMEWMPTALVSLEEQKQRFKDAIMMLPSRTAFVVRPNEKMVKIETLDVPDIRVSGLKKQRVIGGIKASSAIHKRREDVTREIEERLGKIQNHILDDCGDPMNPEP